MSAAEEVMLLETGDHLSGLKTVPRWVAWKYLPDGNKVPINAHTKPFPHRARVIELVEKLACYPEITQTSRELQGVHVWA